MTTADGVDAILAQGAHLANERRILSGLTPAEQRQLADMLRKLTLTLPARQHDSSPSAPTAKPTPAAINSQQVDDDYPAGLIAREPAPRHDGEGAFALWHFSEDASLARFLPHVPATNPGARPLVWAVDTRHAPMFWFPRDCPRGCIWPGPATTPADRERFFGQSAATRIHVIEAGWLARMRACRLYAYRLPAGPFRPHDVGGYWVSDEPAEAIERVVIDDLFGRHARAGIELRVTPSIWPFWRRVVGSTVKYSGIRLHNAAPHCDQVS